MEHVKVAASSLEFSMASGVRVDWLAECLNGCVAIFSAKSKWLNWGATVLLTTEYLVFQVESLPSGNEVKFLENSLRSLISREQSSSVHQGCLKGF